MVGDLAKYKQAAAEHAVANFVKSGMVVGLGHGSTALYAARHLAELLKAGKLKDIQGVPCSLAVEREAKRLGIPLTTLDEHPGVDVTIDGADEIDPDLNLIKGGGGALLREKIVAQASAREVIVADHTKQSPALGTKFRLPVEALPFGWRLQAEYLAGLQGGKIKLRKNESSGPFLTDQGNYLLDCDFGAMEDLHGLARAIESRAGILEHGLFLDLATDLVVAGPDGVQHIAK
jgi:ribose 5-phosphate isomerase A